MSGARNADIKLSYGSLYTVVDNLAKHDPIKAMEASREGRRPERTAYRITDEGAAELQDWLLELLGTPVKEYPQFEAALSEMAVLSPTQVTRCAPAPGSGAAQADPGRPAGRARAACAGCPGCCCIESEYHLVLREAELAWVRGPGAGTRGRYLPAEEWTLAPDRELPPRLPRCTRRPARLARDGPGPRRPWTRSSTGAGSGPGGEGSR